MKQLITAVYEGGVLRPLEPVDLKEAQLVRIFILSGELEHGEQEMVRTPVESSLVAKVGYLAKDKVLEIEFQNGRIYHYSDVPERIYKGLMVAESHGRYFNDQIRDAFAYRRIR